MADVRVLRGQTFSSGSTGNDSVRTSAPAGISPWAEGRNVEANAFYRVQVNVELLLGFGLHLEYRGSQNSASDE